MKVIYAMTVFVAVWEPTRGMKRQAKLPIVVEELYASHDSVVLVQVP